MTARTIRRGDEVARASERNARWFIKNRGFRPTSRGVWRRARRILRRQAAAAGPGETGRATRRRRGDLPAANLPRLSAREKGDRVLRWLRETGLVGEDGTCVAWPLDLPGAVRRRPSRGDLSRSWDAWARHGVVLLPVTRPRRKSSPT
uniref:Uncharacterized protein n=1 Tax=viral metagenome TaxID=1070528 RepID=A0A6M3J8Z8_9ZZZZ